MASGDRTACARAPSTAWSGEACSAPKASGDRVGGPGFAHINELVSADSRAGVLAVIGWPRDTAARDIVCGFGLSLKLEWAAGLGSSLGAGDGRTLAGVLFASHPLVSDHGSPDGPAPGSQEGRGMLGRRSRGYPSSQQVLQKYKGDSRWRLLRLVELLASLWFRRRPLPQLGVLIGLLVRGHCRLARLRRARSRILRSRTTGTGLNRSIGHP